jgi:glyoxylate/hydroxypyruvate reductase A
MGRMNPNDEADGDTIRRPPIRDSRLVVLVASFIDGDQLDRMVQAAPDKVRVIFDPELVPKPRYPGDHVGVEGMSAAAVRRWKSLLAEADVMFDFDWLDCAALPHSAPRLKWVQATSAGIGEFLRANDLVDTGIIFTTASGVHAGPLGEFVLLSLLYFAKDMPRLLSLQRGHAWERHTVGELAGQRVLIVGLGKVGREIARRCVAMGVHVWGMRRDVSGIRLPEIERLVSHKELRSALPLIDGLILSCPDTPETRGMIGIQELQALRSSAILVNVGRGSVVNEDALSEALRSGEIRGAALDVFDREPLPYNSELWDLPNVLICPHSASTVPAENERIVDIFVENLQRLLRGEALLNQFDPVRGY